MIKNEEIDKQIKKLFFTHKEKLKPQYKSLLNKYDLTNYVINRYDDSSSIIESLNRIYYHIEIRPVCKHCGAPVKYYKLNKFSDFCSVKCAMNSEEVKHRCKDLLQKKYGVDNVYQLESVKNKIRETNLERYGEDNYVKTNEYKECSKQTCLNKYGVEHASQTSEFKEKVKKTNNKKYGCDYGLQSPEIKQKSINTCKEKYGVEYFAQSSNFKELFTDENFVRNAKLKEYATRKNKNNGNDFNTSKDEQLLLSYLKNKFPDLIYQYYTDERYPFNCDFYIPSLDLFIEYNGHWTHNDHIFDENDNNDLLLLEEIKEKSKQSKYYKIYEDTWTHRDPLKVKTAKENNLNYLIIWHHEFNANKLNYEFIDNQISKFIKIYESSNAIHI